MTRTQLLPISALLAVAGFAGAQTSIDRTGQTDQAFGLAAGLLDPETVPFTASVASSFFFGGELILEGGTISSVGPGTWLSEARIRLSNSAFPASTLDYVPRFVTSEFTNANILPGIVTPVGFGVTFATPLGRQMIPAGSTWSVSVFDSFDDAGIGPDARFHNLRFTVNNARDSALTVNVPTANSSDTLGSAANTVVSLPDLDAQFFPAIVSINSATFTPIATGEAASHTRLRVSSPAIPWLIAESILLNSTATVPITLSTIFNFPLGGPLVWNTLGMPANNTLNMEFYQTSQQTAGIPEAVWSNVSLTFIDAPGRFFLSEVPTSFTDLGEISSATATTPMTVSVAAAGPDVRWFRFKTGNVSSDVSIASFLDIWATGTGGDDFVLALFDEFGRFMSGDRFDDAGSNPALTFGVATPARPANGDGVAFNGRDGSSLPSGTYYLAVAADNAAATTTVNLATQNFNIQYVNPPFFTPNGGVLSLRSSAVNATDVTGTIGISSFAAGLDQQLFTYEVFDSVGTRVEYRTFRADAAGNFSFPISVAAGSYTLKIKANTTLRKAFSITANGGVAGLGSVMLTNGNANGDGEIGPADFSEVLSGFGQESSWFGQWANSADLDKNNEVGPADFSIVLAAFGSEDE